MRFYIIFAGLLLIETSDADVFKCKGASGEVAYQAEPCATGSSEKVAIEPSDPKKILEAQARLAESLKREEEEIRKERELAAQEAMAAGINRQLFQ